MMLSDIPRHEDLLKRITQPTGWVHVDETPKRSYFISIPDIDTADVALTQREQFTRLISRGFKPCKVCGGWRSPGQTPAEHHEEEHFGIRLQSASRDWNYSDDDPWIPDMDDITGSRYERRTPITAESIQEYDAGARKQLDESYQNYRDRSGQ